MNEGKATFKVLTETVYDIGNALAAATLSNDTPAKTAQATMDNSQAGVQVRHTRE